jgi:hypothetical protein
LLWLFSHFALLLLLIRRAVDGTSLSQGFLIQTDVINRVIDPSASFTLEYLDMIMTIRANGWKVNCPPFPVLRLLP